MHIELKIYIYLILNLILIFIINIKLYKMVKNIPAKRADKGVSVGDFWKAKE